MNLHDREHCVSLIKAAQAKPMLVTLVGFVKAFNEDQPRDDKGQWTSDGGGSSGGSKETNSSAPSGASSGSIPTRGDDRMYVESSAGPGGSRQQVPKAVSNLYEQVKDESDGGASRLKAGLSRMTDQQVIALGRMTEGLTGAGKYKEFASALSEAIRHEWNSRANSKDFQDATRGSKK